MDDVTVLDTVEIWIFPWSPPGDRFYLVRTVVSGKITTMMTAGSRQLESHELLLAMRLDDSPILYHWLWVVPAWLGDTSHAFWHHAWYSRLDFLFVVCVCIELGWDWDVVELITITMAPTRGIAVDIRCLMEAHARRSMVRSCSHTSKLCLIDQHHTSLGHNINYLPPQERPRRVSYTCSLYNRNLRITLANRRGGSIP